MDTHGRHHDADYGVRSRRKKKRERKREEGRSFHGQASRREDAQR